MSTHFCKKEVKKANTLFKKFLISLIIRKMQIKVLIRRKHWD
jgi:hypothetical protein